MNKKILSIIITIVILSISGVGLFFLIEKFNKHITGDFRISRNNFGDIRYFLDISDIVTINPIPFSNYKYFNFSSFSGTFSQIQNTNNSDDKTINFTYDPFKKLYFNIDNDFINSNGEIFFKLSNITNSSSIAGCEIFLSIKHSSSNQQKVDYTDGKLDFLFMFFDKNNSDHYDKIVINTLNFTFFK